MLLITVPTIDWSALCWLEGDFRLLATVRTDDFVHCPRTAIRTTTHRPSTPPMRIGTMRTHYVNNLSETRLAIPVETLSPFHSDWKSYRAMHKGAPCGNRLSRRTPNKQQLY